MIADSATRREPLYQATLEACSAVTPAMLEGYWAGKIYLPYVTLSSKFNRLLMEMLWDSASGDFNLRRPLPQSYFLFVYSEAFQAALKQCYKDPSVQQQFTQLVVESPRWLARASGLAASVAIPSAVIGGSFWAWSKAKPNSFKKYGPPIGKVLAVAGVLGLGYLMYDLLTYQSEFDSQVANCQKSDRQTKEACMERLARGLIEPVQQSGLNAKAFADELLRHLQEGRAKDQEAQRGFEQALERTRNPDEQAQLREQIERAKRRIEMATTTMSEIEDLSRLPQP